MTEAPEFHTRHSTPLSPQPVHPSEPSNVKVLREQTDPVFNMTSTHISASGIALNDATSNTDSIGEHDNQANPNDTSFSDACEAPKADENSHDVNAPDSNPSQIDDDYARTFDSDVDIEADAASKPDSAEPYSPSLDNQLAQTFPPLSGTSSVMSVPLQSFSTTDISNSPVASVSTIPVVHGNEYAKHSFSSSYTPRAQAAGQARDAQHAKDEVDIQTLLDNITANAELQRSNETAAFSQSASTSQTALYNPPTSTGLPPRPQVVQLPSNQPAYSATNNLRSSLPPPPGLGDIHGAPGTSIPSLAAGAPGTATDSKSTLPPPPSAAMFFSPPIAIPQLPASSLPPPPQRVQPPQPAPRDAKNSDRIEGPDYGEVVLNPVMEKLFDEFLADEREYTADGQWDRFAPGSRLFIGNVPSEKVTKKDMFAQFQRYGRLAQISIKNAYGFVQFLEAASCQRALVGEQDQFIRGRRMHLEISKPSKKTQAAATSGNDVKQRSRQDGYDRNDRGIDRGVSRNAPAPSRNGYIHGGNDPYLRRDSRDDDYRGVKRNRDEYRGTYRSPSPRSRNGRVYGDTNRGIDSYRGRDTYSERRTRSPTPPSYRRDNGRYSRRSPSPRRTDQDDDEALPIPRRNPIEVPDVFIILIDDLNRDFVSWVESEIRSRGLRTEVMHLNPRIPLDKVIRRQVLEGVHAVTVLTRSSEDAGKIPLRVFDRRAGANNVRFDEYQDLNPKIAAELVIRVKTQTTSALGPIRSAGPMATDSVPNMIGSLDNHALQQLLGTLIPKEQPSQASHAPPQSSLDLASILGGLKQQPQQPYQTPLPPSLPSQQQNSGYNGYLPPQIGTQQQDRPQPQQHIQEIMAQLAKFKK